MEQGAKGKEQKNEERKDMQKKITILALTAMLFALYVSAEAQQVGKVYRVGYLSGGFARSTFNIDAIRRELRELGYVEGKNISFEARYAEDKSERSPALADELVRLKVDVIIAGGSNDTRAAKKATQTIPIVFTDAVSDPVARGLVDSLARPGGNVTGFYSMADVLAGKRLQVLKESIPKLSRVAVLWYPKIEGSEPQWTESQLAARQLGLQLYSMEVGSTDNYESAFKEAIKSGSAGLAVTRHRLSQSNVNQKLIIELAAKYRLPAIYFREDFVEQGLMSYGADEIEPFKRVAVMVDKILKGTKPADIPVEQSTKFEFVVNLKTAKQFGVNIPPEVLSRANKIIK
jgi:putative tryptophan/tyrosine transport system substrate-binding protein